MLEFLSYLFPDLVYFQGLTICLIPCQRSPAKNTFEKVIKNSQTMWEVISAHMVLTTRFLMLSRPQFDTNINDQKEHSGSSTVFCSYALNRAVIISHIILWICAILIHFSTPFPRWSNELFFPSSFIFLTVLVRLRQSDDPQCGNLKCIGIIILQTIVSWKAELPAHG